MKEKNKFIDVEESVKILHQIEELRNNLITATEEKEKLLSDISILVEKFKSFKFEHYKIYNATQFIKFKTKIGNIRVLMQIDHIKLFNWSKEKNEFESVRFCGNALIVGTEKNFPFEPTEYLCINGFSSFFMNDIENIEVLTYAEAMLEIEKFKQNILSKLSKSFSFK